MEVIDLLKPLKIFSELTESELSLIAGLARIEEFKEKDVIFKEGTSGEAFYVIIEGSIWIYKEVAKTTKKSLATLGKGESFGELSIFDGLPRSATAVAKTDCSLAVFNGKDFNKLLNSQPTLAVKVLRSVINEFSSRQRTANEEIAAWIVWAMPSR